MQDLSKLSILLLTAVNLAGLRAVDGRVAAATALAALLWLLVLRLGWVAPAGRRHAWITLLARHKAALAKRHRQLVRPNAYGFEETEKWLDQLDRFRRSVGLELVAKDVLAFDRLATARIRAWVDADADTAMAAAEKDLSPEDYEHHCAELLRRAGWEAEVTGMS